MKNLKQEKTVTMENKESNPKSKKKISKKSIILYSVIGVVGITLSAVGGVLLGRNLFKQDAYAGLDINNAEVDYNEVYARFKTSNANSYFEDFSHVELANISLLKCSEVNNFYTITNGSVEAAGVKQTIHGTTIRDGDNYFEESISSSSFVKSTNRFYQNDDGVKWHKGKYVDLDGGDYSNPKTTDYTIDEFDDTWGKSLKRACIYIVSNKSCLNSTMTKTEDGNYEISLDLDPTLSVLRYVKQMVMTGGLSEAPVFHSVNLTFTVDKDVNLLTFKTYEVYDVHMVIDAKNSKGSLTQEFKYEKRDIPNLTDATNYK